MLCKILLYINAKKSMTKPSILSIIILTIISLAAEAQDIADVVAQETCDCISKKDLSNVSDRSQIEMALGVCMLESFGKHEKEVNNHFKYDANDRDAMRKIGEKVGVKMAPKCPKIFEKIASLSAPPKASVSEVKEIAGTLKDLVQSDFATLVVEDANGRKHDMLWIGYFKGSEDLGTNYKEHVGKKVKVRYTELECYSPKLKEYINKKEVKELTFQ